MVSSLVGTTVRFRASVVLGLTLFLGLILLNGRVFTAIGYKPGATHGGHELETEPSERILTVLMSDRIEGIIPTLGSLVNATESVVEVLLIGDAVVNDKVRDHFGDRIGFLHTMTLKDVEEDLLSQDVLPLWKWDQFGSSREKSWNNENTIHMADWDGLQTHENVLNHMRFYIPYLSVLNNVQHYYLLDDDILVNKDISRVTAAAVASADATKGLICPCNVWKWSPTCNVFEFKSQDIAILDSTPLYGSTEQCASASSENCVPDSYQDFLEAVVPVKEALQEQLAWNFGFCYVSKDNWQRLKLTEKYESVMKESYKKHVFPENSLAFGLGVAYLAFIGSVGCWNDEDVKVRDGLGFVEPVAFEKMLGQDFFSSIDVAHYTGPTKPWSEFPSLKEKTLKPWLKAMELEGLKIPPQHTSEPAKEVFSLLTSWRSGSEWIMQALDEHPKICASGETHSPQLGFPAESLNVNDSPHLPDCSTKKGCSLHFIRKQINKVTGGGAMTRTRSLCSFSPREDIRLDDGLTKEHLKRVCNFIDRLHGNFTAPAVLRTWVDAFVSEDDDILGCTCPRGSHVKGQKIMDSWIDDDMGKQRLDGLDQTAFAGSKVIRLERKNLFQRYKSLLIAKTSKIWHARTQAEAKVHGDIPVYIPVDFMLATLERMYQAALKADDWARAHASDVLWVDYDECRAASDACLNKMFAFLGVDEIKNIEGKVLPFSTSEWERSLDNVINKDEVREALCANGWGAFIGHDDGCEPIQLLIYETNLLPNSRVSSYLEKASRVKGLNATLIGQGTVFGGFGSKYRAAKPHLLKVHPESLVVLSDGRDVLLNVDRTFRGIYSDLAEFKRSFNELNERNPNSVVVSAEGQCCVTALSHFEPGELFDSDGKRKSFACTSGEEGCEWDGDKAVPWLDFMQSLAEKRGFPDTDNVYLNAGLIAGKAKNLLILIDNLNMNEQEDDQAVLTEYMFHHPDMVLLDYQGRLFGSNQWTKGMEDKGCLFDFNRGDDLESTATASRRLSHVETGSKPLFIHSQGQFFECQKKLTFLLSHAGKNGLFDDQQTSVNEAPEDPEESRQLRRKNYA